MHVVSFFNLIRTEAKSRTETTDTFYQAWWPNCWFALTLISVHRGYIFSAPIPKSRPQTRAKEAKRGVKTAVAATWSMRGQSGWQGARRGRGGLLCGSSSCKTSSTIQFKIRAQFAQCKAPGGVAQCSAVQCSLHAWVRVTWVDSYGRQLALLGSEHYAAIGPLCHPIIIILILILLARPHHLVLLCWHPDLRVLRAQ